MVRANLADRMLRIRNLHKRFGDQVAVDGLDLEVHRGETFEQCPRCMRIVYSPASLAKYEAEHGVMGPAAAPEATPAEEPAPPEEAAAPTEESEAPAESPAATDN